MVSGCAEVSKHAFSVAGVLWLLVVIRGRGGRARGGAALPLDRIGHITALQIPAMGRWGHQKVTSGKQGYNLLSHTRTHTSLGLADVLRQWNQVSKGMTTYVKIHSIYLKREWFNCKWTLPHQVLKFHSINMKHCWITKPRNTLARDGLLCWKTPRIHDLSLN